MDWQRRGDPQVRLDRDIRKNPAAEERQREDLRQLVNHNKNPRLNELVSSDLRRSERFQNYDAIGGSLDEEIFKAKTKTISRYTGEPLASVTERMSQISFSPKHSKSVGQGAFFGAGAGSPSRTAGSPGQADGGMSEVEIEDAPVMHNYDVALKLAPPSFGHRPGSASRTFNPVAMGIKRDKKLALVSSRQIMKKKSKKKAAGKNVTGIMSTSMLKHLLSGGDMAGGEQPQSNYNNDYNDSNNMSFDDLSIDTYDRGGVGEPLNTTIDSELQHSFTTLSPKHAIEPTNHSSYFDEVYKVPPVVDKPDWTDSFAAAHYNVQDFRPLRVLNREDREAKTMDRIERFRLLAAGKTNSKTTNPDRDASMLQKSAWKEELDRKFNKLDRTGVKISPRSAASNRDVNKILKERKMREVRLNEKIRNWERVVEEERTEKIIARKRGKGKLIYDGK